MDGWKYKDRYIDRQTDRQTNRQIAKHTDRQTLLEGWMEGKAGLRIAQSNQKGNSYKNEIVFLQSRDTKVVDFK